MQTVHSDCPHTSDILFILNIITKSLVLTETFPFIVANNLVVYFMGAVK